MGDTLTLFEAAIAYVDAYREGFDISKAADALQGVVTRNGMASVKSERVRIADRLHKLGTPEAHLHAGMIERGEI